jgi:DNA-binding MarR family transcriptional regulator
MPAPVSKPVPVAEPMIAGVRRFNRFYTKRIGVLEEGMVDTAFSLQEARVLYELGQAEGIGAGELAARLSLDAGYLSRLVGKLESQGLVTRQAGEEDRRRSHVTLTAPGRKAFRKLDDGSRKDIQALLGPLCLEDRSRLLTAMGGIERVLGDEPEEKVPFILRSPASGDYGWVVHRHGILYNQEYGWDETFEGLVAQIVAEIVGGVRPEARTLLDRRAPWGVRRLRLPDPPSQGSETRRSSGCCWSSREPAAWASAAGSFASARPSRGNAAIARSCSTPTASWPRPARSTRRRATASRARRSTTAGGTT